MLYLTYFLLYAFVFIFGSCIGSFLNVVIYRMPNKISIADGRSFCPNCKSFIKNYDLIPIISFFVLKRKCRNCGQKISWRYPLVEAFVGLVAVIIFIHYFFTAKALLAFAFCAVLVAVSFIEYDKNKVPLSLIITLLPFTALSYFVFDNFSLISRIIGITVIILPFIAIKLFRKNFISYDAIAVMSLCGFFVGYKLIIISLIIGAIIQAVNLLINKSYNKIKHYNLGAFCVGFLTSLLAYQYIIDFLKYIFKN